jgi:photosystem II stability/assembly factor-like uncharacterized protein
MHTISKRILFLISVFLLTVSAVPPAYSQWVQTTALPNSAIHGFGTIGTTLFAGTEGGIFLTSDNGTTWTPSNSGFAGGIAYSFTTIGSNIFVGSDSGILVSTDMGGSWSKKITDQSDEFVTAFAQGTGNLYAGVESGVLLSSNNGNSWSDISAGLPGRRTLSLAASGQNIFAGGTGGVYVSTNNGGNWTLMDKGLLNDLIFTLFANGQTMYAGTNAGVASSTNAGEEWLTDTAGMSFTTVDGFAEEGSALFAASFNLAGSVFLSTNAGVNWVAANDGLPPTIRPIYAIAVCGSNLYIGTNGDGVWQCPLSYFGISGVSQSVQDNVSFTSYPNPFPQSTTITFSSSESGPAQVTVVNLLGQQVAQLFDGALDAGEHSFTWDGKDLPAGTYFCQISSSAGGGTRHAVPMMLSR